MRIDSTRRSGRLLLALGTRLVVALLGLLRRTCRVEVVEGRERVERIVADGEPVILAFWHNRAIVGANYLIQEMVARGYPMVLVASRSRDGELVARFAGAHGVGSVRGSSSRGGRAALSGSYRALVDDHQAPIIIPDGPRGPAYELKPGVVALSQMAGAAILPLGFAARRSWILGSWDRLIIPRPFSRVTVAAGEPIRVPRKLSTQEREAARRRCEEELMRVTRKAEAAAGVSDPLG